MLASKNNKTTAIIVNFFSAKFTLAAVNSILFSRSVGPVETVVVDNSCDVRERNTLQANLPPQASLVVSSDNIGFGRACNLVFEASDSDFYLLLNPDAYLVGQALWQMQQVLLNNPKAGAVSPQAYWDDECNFFIPPAQSPLIFLLQPEINHLEINSYLKIISTSFWRNYSIKVWKASSPVETNNICGGHVLIKREAIEYAGGLFDPAFFLYFEDTDLFMRIKRAGYQLLLQPKAKAVHYYNQCAPDSYAYKQLQMRTSHRLFVEKHLDLKLNILKKLLITVNKNKGDKRKRYPNSETLIGNPLDMTVPTRLQKDWLFEWSPSRDFIPSVGYFGKGDKMTFPQLYCDNLAPGKYFFRFGEPSVWGRVSRVLTWEKV